MLNEATIRSFLTAARTHSMTEAARRLFLSQQAVSKHLARLEQDLDCTLFHRERGNLKLTEAGQLYYDAFCQAEQAVQAARRETARRALDRNADLVIAHIELLDTYRFFKSLYRDFQMLHAEVRITYKSSSDRELISWLMEDKADLAFLFQEETAGRPELECLVVDQLQELLVVSSDHPLARPDATYLDFREEPVFYGPAPGEEDTVARRLVDMGFRRDRLVPTENLLSSCASVEQRMGVTFLTDCCRLLSSAAFRTYPTNHTTALVMAWRRSNRKRALRQFVEHVRERQLPHIRRRSGGNPEGGRAHG